MSQFFDQASLVMIPSGYKNGKVYSQKPLSADGELTFTRASTATRVNASGLIESVASGVPRLDYSGGATCPSLLLEPQTTALNQYSEQLDNAYFSKSNILNVDSNVVVSPDGQTSADRMKPDTTYNQHYINNTSIALSGKNTISVFAKYNGYNVGLRAQGIGNGRAFVNFDLQNGTILGSGGIDYDDSSITSFGDGWYRISLTLDQLSAYGFGIYVVNGTTATELPVFSGDGTSGVYLWGVNCTQTSYLQSYIPTLGSAVTCLADTATKEEDSLISTQEFTLFFEHKALGSSGTDWIYRVDISGTGDDISLYTSSSIGLNVYLGSGNGGYIFGNSANDGFTIGSDSKVALTYNGDRLAYFINGSLYDSASGISFVDNVNSLILRGQKAIAQKKCLVFPEALTDAQCIELTTL